MTPETLKHSGRKLVPQLAQGLLRADSVRPLNTMNQEVSSNRAGTDSLHLPHDDRLSSFAAPQNISRRHDISYECILTNDEDVPGRKRNTSTLIPDCSAPRASTAETTTFKRSSQRISCSFMPLSSPFSLDHASLAGVRVPGLQDWELELE